MRQSESLSAFAKAFVKVQAQMRPAAKDSVNPHFKSKYADLASVWDACRGPLTANGFSVVQGAEKHDGKIRVVTKLLHESGEFIESEIELQPVDSRPQSDGSAITYGRRYALAAMVGICQDDDDGNEASGTVEPANGRKKRTESENGNAYYLAMASRLKSFVNSEDGRVAWPNGNAEVKAWAVTAKGHPFKSWSDVETCTESDKLEKLFDVIKQESVRRVNELEKNAKPKRETAGVI